MIGIILVHNHILEFNVVFKFKLKPKFFEVPGEKGKFLCAAQHYKRVKLIISDTRKMESINYNAV